MEMRKDYILDRWVIVSKARGQRPKEFKKDEIIREQKDCFFCSGNEKLIPEIVYEQRDHKGNWLVRAFHNKYPAVAPYKTKPIKKKFLFSKSPFGIHEVLVETSQHDRQLASFSKEELKPVIQAYIDRTKVLSSRTGIKYVSVFKNHGSAGGTSLVHSHSQIVAYDKIPKLIDEELAAVKKYDKCPFCQIAELESKTERFVFENESFIVFCPYASRFNYEAWILPKKHINSILKINAKELEDLAEAMHKILSKLSQLNCSYNFYIHTSPKGHDLHFHLEFCPRIATWAGFELSTDDIINSVPPEDAAAWYREKI